MILNQNFCSIKVHSAKSIQNLCLIQINILGPEYVFRRMLSEQFGFVVVVRWRSFTLAVKTDSSWYSCQILFNRTLCSIQSHAVSGDSCLGNDRPLLPEPVEGRILDSGSSQLSCHLILNQRHLCSCVVCPDEWSTNHLIYHLHLYRRPRLQ